MTTVPLAASHRRRRGVYTIVAYDSGYGIGD